MRNIQLIRDDLAALPERRQRLRKDEARLMQEAQDHPRITMSEAGELAGVTRVTAYRIAKGRT